MGYVSSKSDFLLGLGVSSSSDVFTGYAQNVKSVEGYIEKINEGRLAVFKGHFMSEVDVVTKLTINEIMCNERVPVSCFSGLTVDYKTNIYQSLKELEDDGLIELGEFLEVTETGKKFVRNIASVFDYRIFSEAASQKFSMSI
jgi:oxygen-independent coproporphyrinogen-3 oxidase